MSTWPQDVLDFFSGTEAISVKSGDFANNPNTRFSGVEIVAYRDLKDSNTKVVIKPSEIFELEIIQKGFFARNFDETAKFFKYLFGAGKASVVLPIIDQLTPDVVPGQRAIVAWLNGVLVAGVTAREALADKEMCEFQVKTKDNRILIGATETRFLLRRLPNFYAGIAQNQSVKTVVVSDLQGQRR